MSFHLPGEINPFEAPRAGIGEDALYLDLADNDAELIRREHIGREANIKSLGRLGYLGAFFAALCSIMMALVASGVIPQPPNQRNGLDPSMQKLLFGGLAFFYLVAGSVFGGLGFGLTHLQVWARWTTVVLISLFLIYVAFVAMFLSFMVNPIAGLFVMLFGGGIIGMILYLLISNKSGMVFSSEYREVIRKTPNVRQQTSIIVKILVVILVALVSGIVLTAIFGGGNR